jgi:hypothetical protein
MTFSLQSLPPAGSLEESNARVAKVAGFSLHAGWQLLEFVNDGRECLTWTPPVCQVNFGEEDRLQSYIRPVGGVYPPGLYGIRRRGPI